jgi:iron complex outermembrane recepter protein
MTIPIVSTDLPLHLHQYGATASASWTSGKLQIKTFVTVQQTKALDYFASNMMPAPGRPVNIYSGMGTEQTLKSTPAVFGGAALNYTPAEKLNINISSYYYSKQSYQHLSSILLNDNIRGRDRIPGKLLLNANLTYEPAPGLRLFCSAKNILNKKSREFFGTDAVPFMMLGGIGFEL